jgi:hypothetical protein
MIFNGHTFGPANKQSRGYKNSSSEYARRLVERACKLRMGN